MRERPDQLDVQISMAVNAIRRDVGEARHRLGLAPREHVPMTADMVHWIDLQAERHA